MDIQQCFYFIWDIHMTNVFPIYTACMRWRVTIRVCAAGDPCWVWRRDPTPILPPAGRLLVSLSRVLLPACGVMIYQKDIITACMDVYVWTNRETVLFGYSELVPRKLRTVICDLYIPGNLFENIQRFCNDFNNFEYVVSWKQFHISVNFDKGIKFGNLMQFENWK